MQAESESYACEESKVAIATFGIYFLSCLSVALRVTDLFEVRLNAVDWHDNGGIYKCHDAS